MEYTYLSRTVYRTKIVDKPLKRIDMTRVLDKKPGTLSASLKRLQDRGLLNSDKGLYSPYLKHGLKGNEKKGIYPYRTI